LIFIIFYFLTIVHTVQSDLHSSFTIRRGLACFVAQQEKQLHGVSCRESDSGLPYSKPTHYHLNHAAPFEPCRTFKTEPRRTLKKLAKLSDWGCG
jgi:hypothetical protein